MSFIYLLTKRHNGHNINFKMFNVFKEPSSMMLYPKSSAAMMKNPTAKPVKIRMATMSMMVGMVRMVRMVRCQLPGRNLLLLLLQLLC